MQDCRKFLVGEPGEQKYGTVQERMKSGGFGLERTILIPILQTSGVLIIRVQEIERKNSKKCS
jgi:hypothetical protein